VVDIQRLLTDKERELQGKKPDLNFERAQAVGAVARLAGVLQDPGIALERARLSDVDRARALSAASKTLLDILDPVHPRSESHQAAVKPERPSGRRMSEVVREGGFPAVGLKYLRDLVDDPYEGLRIEHIGIVVDEILNVAQLNPRKNSINHREALISRLGGAKIEEIGAAQGRSAPAIYQALRLVSEKVKENPEVSQLPANIMNRIASIGEVELPAAVPSSDPAQPEATPRVDTGPILPRTVIVERRPTGTQVLTSIERGPEPRHVQVTDLIASYVELEGAQRAALQSFLDPKSRGDMTTAKEEIVEKLRVIVRNGLDAPVIELAAAEAAQVRKVFGAYGEVRNPRDMTPVPLVDILKSLGYQTDRNAATGQLFDGLEKIFSPLVAARRSA
jgi:hypothetical protein